MSIGSRFDDFLKEEGILEATVQAARQKVLALQETTPSLESSQQNIASNKDSSGSIQVKLD